MDDYCIICDHPAREHWGSGCHKSSFLRGSCDCTFAEQAPLPTSAGAAQYRKRADWWNERIRTIEHHIDTERYGSDRRRRLELFRDKATDSARLALEMVELTEVKETRERAAREAAEAAAAREAERASEDVARQELLDGIAIETIQSQPLCTLGMLEEQFDISPASDQLAVRNRVAAEFNALPPVERRELLENEHARALLEHIGVVSHWSIGLGQTNGSLPDTEKGSQPLEDASEEWADGIMHAANDPDLGALFDEAMRKTQACARFVEQLDAEYGTTVGDAYWAQTEAEEGRLPRDESFIAEYERNRSQVEAYWHSWAMAPSPMLQQAFMRQDPERFKRHMTLAIELLTPREKFCFASHDELFGWIASGMKPLFVDGRHVRLDEVIEPRYLTAA